MMKNNESLNCEIWEVKINDNGKETIKQYESKKIAKAQMNKMIRSLMKMFSLEEFYSEKENWYEIIILADLNLDEDEIAEGKNITIELNLIQEEIEEEE